jgi:hypothetical protein
MSSRAILVACFVLAVSCERPRFTMGEGCTVNSDCAAPLICVIDACRRQCEESIDCGAGLRCLPSPMSELGGVCQLPEEAICTLTSDCTAPLVCQFSTCTTECVEDRDCPRGATCTAVMSGGFACYEEMLQPCVYNSDCMDPRHICDRNQRCRFECLGDRDCQPPRVCVNNFCELPDGG